MFYLKLFFIFRRKTNGITDITVIGESPIKRCDDMQSTFRISAREFEVKFILYLGARSRSHTPLNPDLVMYKSEFMLSS